MVLGTPTIVLPTAGPYGRQYYRGGAPYVDKVTVFRLLPRSQKSVEDSHI